ncbi:MAG: ATP-binding cassette domain-containing protein, partial [Atribacterota bacterium]
ISSPADALANGIGYLPRDRDQEGLIIIHSIKNNICLPILNIVSRLFGTISIKAKKKIADKFFHRLNIRAKDIEVTCINLSGGNRQKVVFAKLMATEVDIMILNHPTRGVDVGAKQEFYTLMQDFVKRGLSIIVVSDELPELIGMSDRIIIMRDGRLVYISKPGEQPQEEQLVRYMLK